MPVIKRILVATDFSETAALAVDYAKTLAEPLHASLHVIHVMQDPIVTNFEGYFPPESLWENMEAAANGAIQQVLSNAERQKFHATLFVTRGIPADQIVNYAVESKIDLIVLGTHGRGPFVRFLLGSVADRVIRKAACPVLTVGPIEHKR